MKTLTLGLVALLSVALVAGNAFAFSCPTLVKAANEEIAKAEPKAAQGADDRQKARNAGMIEVAKSLSKEAEADHAGGKHAQSEAKAKAAKWLAEQVK
ncbi:MAG TPA: hypothetical protein VGW35_05505 [Methylomirabilota bacterium]|nr:hypothetical protein [Methylomirabilota bacterium]